MHRLLLPVLSHYSGTGFFVSPDIPEVKEQTLRQILGVKDDEAVLALLDVTLLGNARAGAVFTNEGLRWLNNASTNQPAFCPWDLLMKAPTVLGEEGWIQIGGYGQIGASLRIGLNMMTPFTVFNLITDIKTALIMAQSNGVLDRVLGEQEGLEQAKAAWTLSYKGERHGPYDLTLAARLIATGRLPVQGALAKQERMARFEPVGRIPILMEEINRIRMTESAEAGLEGLGSSDWWTENQEARGGGFRRHAVASGGAPETGGPPPAVSAKPSLTSPEETALELNQARLSDLLVLPGLDHSSAGMLLRERHKRGGFHSVDEALGLLRLMPHERVKLKRRLCVTPPAGARRPSSAAPSDPPPPKPDPGVRLID